ncbi:MAG: hypothetical protein ACXW2U_03820 [Telluria sp.]
MKNEKLTTDEYDALEHIRRGAGHDRVNACVGRNAKRLSGIKLIQYEKSGKVALTPKGQEVLFLRRCVETLRALSANPAAPVEADVLLFLGKKSHIAASPEGGYLLTDKGRDSLADIESQAS